MPYSIPPSPSPTISGATSWKRPTRWTTPLGAGCAVPAGVFIFALLALRCSLVPLAHGQTDSTRTDTSAHAPEKDPIVDASPGGLFHDDLLLDGSAERWERERAAEHLENLRARPVDLNTASVRTLMSLPGLSPATARRIVRHRTEAGPLDSPADLIVVSGLTKAQYRRLRPFITTSSQHRQEDDREHRTSWSEAIRNSDIRASYRWSQRLDLGRGYDDDTTRTTFAGGPGRHITRVDVRLGDRLRAAGALDKDPGEAWRWNPHDGAPGFDHVSGTLAVHSLGPFETIVAGDYTIAAGQGVGLWSGMAFGKGRSPTGNVLRSGRGLAPFASTEENRFFRGAAAVLNAGRLVPGLDASSAQIQITPFLSRRRLDASWSLNEETGMKEFRTRQSGGLHRTPTEREHRDALLETVAGSVAEVSAQRWRAGGAVFTSDLRLPPAAPSRPDEAFDPARQHVTVATMFAEGDALGSLWAGELTRGPGGAWGGVAAWSYDDTQGVEPVRVETIVHGRYYAAGFAPPFSAGFSETSPQNESGIYAGARLHVQPDVRISGYVDQYQFAWLRYNVPRPTTGRDVRLVVEHEPRDWLAHYVQVRSETKETGLDLSPARSPLAVEAVGPSTRQSLRWAVTYRWSRRLRLRSRVEGVRVQRAGTDQWHYGTVLLQDASWRPHPRLLLAGRIAVFDTDGFAARVYAYERGVRYAFSVPALFGRGERSYLLMRLSLSDNATLEAKYGVTRYDDRTTVGSGLAEISGNRVRNVDVQLHWRW